LALYKANPDAFAGGSIHRLNAGAELYKPSQALLQSITPAAAKTFVAKSNENWSELKKSGESSATKDPDSKVITTSKSLKDKENNQDKFALDRLKIGPGIGADADQRRFQEELVVQEQALAQARARAAELEKNIADLQVLLNQQKAVQQGVKTPPAFAWGPVMLVGGILLLTGILFWFLARYTRQAERVQAVQIDNTGDLAKSAVKPTKSGNTSAEIPLHAKALFAGLNLDLGSPPLFERLDPRLTAVAAPLAPEALQVKLNLARAYITIEDFAAARACLGEIMRAELATDLPANLALINAAQNLLQSLNERGV
jgi:pilus assembly protein FimV